MARIDEKPEERDTVPLTLENILECPDCGTEFDHVFTAPEGIYEREDLVDPPEDDATCPSCGHLFHATWEGWIAHEDAG